MSTKPLTEREDNAVAQLYDTVAELIEDSREHLTSGTRQVLTAALDEMVAARKAAKA